MKYELYKQFSLCYNSGDFSSIDRKLHDDCMYQSFDFLYVLKGKQKIIDELENQAKHNLIVDDEKKVDIYSGYYSKQVFILKTLKECCIVVRRSDKKSIRILSFNKKWGKVSQIIGLDPDKTKHVKCLKV